MILHRHQDLERTSSAPGLFRIIAMDEKLGSGAITQGMVTIEPGRQTRPHTHRVEESMTLLEGRLRVLIGAEVAEVDAPATFLAPANTVHALRNVGRRASAAVYRVPERERGHVLRRRDRVLEGNGARGGRRGVKRNPARLPGWEAGPGARKALPRLS